MSQGWDGGEISLLLRDNLEKGTRTFSGDVLFWILELPEGELEPLRISPREYSGK